MSLLERLRERLEALGQFRGPEQARASVPAQLSSLFCEELGWARPQGLLEHRLQLSAPLPLEVVALPVAQMSGLPVYYVVWPQEKLPGITARRAVQKALSPFCAEHLVCYLSAPQEGAAGANGSNPARLAFTWARRRSDGKTELRTLPYEVGSPARTTLERLTELAFSPEELGGGQPPITDVTDKLNRAFDVEAVTEQFFADYQRIFDDLQKRLLAQLRADQRCPDAQRWAHDYALQLLNRLMFLYFIQRKRWLGDNPGFLSHFWNSYKHSKQPKNSFFSRWLCVLFFEAFNNRFHGGYTYFPQDIRDALQLAPYLNGGLFRKNRLDEAYSVDLPDDFFTEIFDDFRNSTPGFLERYNFTITESTPFDVEVAVDPQMIGQVYESLVNMTSEGRAEDDQRGQAGIFYTPRVEIDLMCRLALVDVLANHLGSQYKALLYDAVFATDAEEKERADRALSDHNLWPKLNETLRSLTVCDPACGSGSFLVGMLLVLDDLQARANARLGDEETPYERRRRIIGSQLYGVDVMDWAVHVAELRLWLQLVVETELQRAELKFRPLLPNLSFKVCHGDSLVQEIGGINFGLHRQHLDIPSHLKGRLTQLKGKKLRFYQGEEGIGEAALKQEELHLFREILQHKIHALQNQIVALNRQIAAPPIQTELPGMAGGAVPEPHREDLRSRLEEARAELQHLRDAWNALNTAQNVPFVWDIAFVEIFEGDSGGFDIVIGNPPYVRQEKIAPPQLDPAAFGGEDSEAWKKEKKDYKEKLQRSVAAAWPSFFCKPGGEMVRRIDGKSDLYVYFYFHALSLLNPHGSFCFITSNSWLDVGYGADLQEFLLKHSHVKLVLDNEAKRSFAQADVNTVIVLLAPANEEEPWGLQQTARFVVFRRPFEELARADMFKAIEAATDRETTEAYRVTARSQRELLEEGLETDDFGARRGPLVKTARYIGNKWGGKYLRAPDIFFTILEKGKGKLVRLGDIAEVRRGFTTGANEFFYLEPTGKPAPAGYLHVRNGAGWEGEIEEEFLKPVIKSPRECRSILIKPEDLRYKIFMCHHDKSELQGTAALEYIRWGEAQGYYERPSCRGRQRWWDVGVRRVPPIVSPSSVSDFYRAFLNQIGVFIDKRLYEIHPLNNLVNLLAVSLNSTMTTLFLELGSRTGLGEGLLDMTVYEVANCLVLHPSLVQATPFFDRPTQSIFSQIHQPDRRALDEVVFDVLGLTPGEREAVYEAVVNLVRARLEKARSV